MLNVEGDKMSIKMKDGFWDYYRNLVSDGVVPYQWKALNDLVEGAEPSHAITNFEIAAGVKDGEYYGAVFQDSDVYKWLEMTTYSLSYKDNPEIREHLDYTIDLIVKSQEENGYLNTYYQLSAPDKKWTNLRDHHELYCAGHLLEAAVAAKINLNDDRLLDVSKKFVNHISDLFGDDKAKGYPGHQEIELALLKAYELTNDEDYKELANFFIKERGAKPHYFDIEKEGRDVKDLIWNSEPDFNFGLSYKYQQAHDSIYNQTDAVGHSVRAVYYYSAIAKLLETTPDNELFSVVKNLWNDIVNKKMYVTGSIGSNENGESFGEAYDLPNDTMYCETCASIGLIFFANEMSKIDDDSRYADIIEKILYNSSISGMNIDGDRFFYVNPLEVNLDYIADLKYKHVKPVREKWLSVACCPPNLGRLIASLDNYILNIKNNDIYINQFIGSDLNEDKFDLSIVSNMPYSEEIHISLNNKDLNPETSLFVRKADWMDDLKVYVNGDIVELDEVNGYLKVDNLLSGETNIKLTYKLAVREMKSNPKVTENLGKIALSRGPVVYCIEEADNGKDVLQTIVPAEVSYEVVESFIESSIKELKYDQIVFDSYTLKPVDSLYHYGANEKLNTKTVAIPYYLWANRTKGNMKVWINKEEKF